MLLRSALLAGLVVALGLAGCDRYPRDPEKTLETVRGGVMRVGVTEVEPWVWREGEEARGVEADLVRELAEELDARIQWVWGTPEEHLAALEQWQLDLVIGGLTQSSPWSKKIGMSRPYITYAVVVGLPPGVEAPVTFEGAEIAVPWGSTLAKPVEDLGADAVAVDDWWQEGPRLSKPAAVPEWALGPWDMRSSGVEVTKQKHVVAVPPGENAWLVHVERFLHEREPDLRRRLAEAALAQADPSPATRAAEAVP